MAVFRIEKNKNYTVMANYHLRDISLSLKAKGLLSLMLSLPEGWDYTTTSKANNPNVPLRIATQFLIYEIVCGLRNPSTFTLNSTNECGTAGDIFYNAGVASVTNFASNYNTLVSNIQAAKKIPSFTAASSGSAPTINLTGEETSVYDSNGVLSNFSFTDGNGAEFYKSGNNLYITQTGTISSSTVFKATRYLPSAENSTYNVWYRYDFPYPQYVLWHRMSCHADLQQKKAGISHE